MTQVVFLFQFLKNITKWLMIDCVFSFMNILSSCEQVTNILFRGFSAWYLAIHIKETKYFYIQVPLYQNGHLVTELISSPSLVSFLLESILAIACTCRGYDVSSGFFLVPGNHLYFMKMDVACLHSFLTVLVFAHFQWNVLPENA